MTLQIPFYSNEPSILLNSDYIFELWPSNNMTYEQKLNAITRVLVLITILGYLFTLNFRILVVGFITNLVIFGMYKTRKLPKMQEGFEKIIAAEVNKNKKVVEFKEGTKQNPFSNVLLTDINDEPNRKSAPLAYESEQQITTNIKRAVQSINPGIKNTDKILYGDQADKFELDQSNRAFFSTANTRVVSDQSDFVNFLYGNMSSSKEFNEDGARMRVANTQRYNLY
jgi:hypothetical protein